MLVVRAVKQSKKSTETSRNQLSYEQKITCGYNFLNYASPSFVSNPALSLDFYPYRKF
jgi:hypothetical protein